MRVLASIAGYMFVSFVANLTKRLEHVHSSWASLVFYKKIKTLNDVSLILN